MTPAALAAKLGEMYHGAPRGEMAAMVHLFGVKFAADIRESGVSCHDLAEAAGISRNYGAEINKGVNLARYVTPKSS